MKTIKQVLANCQIPDDFNLSKNILYSYPVKEVLTGYYFEKVKDHFYIWLYIQPLVVESEGVHFTFSRRLAKSGGSKAFSLNKLHFPETIRDVNEVLLNDDSLNLIDRLKEARSFLGYFEKDSYYFSELETMAIMSSYLENENSKELLYDLLNSSKMQYHQTQNEYLIEVINNCEVVISSQNSEKLTLFDNWYSTMKERLLGSVPSDKK